MTLNTILGVVKWKYEEGVSLCHFCSSASLRTLTCCPSTLTCSKFLRASLLFASLRCTSKFSGLGVWPLLPFGGAPFMKNQEPHSFAPYYKTSYIQVFFCKIKQYTNNFSAKNMSDNMYTWENSQSSIVINISIQIYF